MRRGVFVGFLARIVHMVLTKKERLALANAGLETVLYLKPNQGKREALSFLMIRRCVARGAAVIKSGDERQRRSWCRCHGW